MSVSLFDKLKGDGAPLPPQPAGRAIALAWLGGFLAIAAVTLLTDHLAIALVLGSFGAASSVCLMFEIRSSSLSA